MSADRETLKAAVLRDLLLVDANGDVAIRLKSGIYRILLRSNARLEYELADAIVDAVIAADGQQGSVEWSPRYTDGSQMFAATFTEAGARRYVDQSKGGLALYRRHCGPWERVDE